ncbi:hypothetical protein [Streptomyces sp. NPDC007856]|uniref:hypothetical protein n=1 Tax=Streptomyces sp. NPDC007856 TaxID=3364781 RepID=UPI003677F98B
MTEQDLLHKQLIDTLTASGSLRTEPWKRAAETVPRHEFLRDGFFRRVEGAVPAAWAPVLDDDAGWLKACYTDESLVTQIAGTIAPVDIRGQIMRQPTSSSTLPSLVLSDAGSPPGRAGCAGAGDRHRHRLLHRTAVRASRG